MSRSMQKTNGKQLMAVVRVLGDAAGYAVAEFDQPTALWTVGALRFKTADEAMAFMDRQLAPLYSVCPACGGQRVDAPRKNSVDAVYTCTACTAIFGTVYSINQYVRIGAPWGGGDAARYFDLEEPGRGRVHGWVNAKGQVVQIG